MTPIDSTPITIALTARFGGNWSGRSLNASGFCKTWRAADAKRMLFIKGVPAVEAEVLLAEADGLRALADAQTIRVPDVVDCWTDAATDMTLLALEWLELLPPDEGFGTRFGRLLADLHRCVPLEGHGRFGWRRDNMIGGTPQTNRWSSTGGRLGWIAFFEAQRLRPMRERLVQRDAPVALLDAIDAVIESMPGLFDDHQPRASLIHGDLWSGNWGMLVDGSPVIYDPAVSCSDAEAELAMMELFGSPPHGFWRAYGESAAVAAGYERRRALYQLYHLLNHVALFGAGYVRQALSVARSLSAH